MRRAIARGMDVGTPASEQDAVNPHGKGVEIDQMSPAFGPAERRQVAVEPGIESRFAGGIGQVSKTALAQRWNLVWTTPQCTMMCRLTRTAIS